MREEVKINCGFKGFKEGGGEGGGGTCHVSGRTEELAEMITFHNVSFTLLLCISNELLHTVETT